MLHLPFDNTYSVLLSNPRMIYWGMNNLQVFSPRAQAMHCLKFRGFNFVCLHREKNGINDKFTVITVEMKECIANIYCQYPAL